MLYSEKKLKEKIVIYDEINLCFLDSIATIINNIEKQCWNILPSYYNNLKVWLASENLSESKIKKIQAYKIKKLFKKESRLYLKA